ncbi:MAG: hypothetical protein KKB03_02425 [Nanoarchaeota archaeon]|nr:hypothetical protein [Nanoarchaeota archaeon]MBU1134996.1 hypothetical protein [Nanoarchaeota archaeon]MBU2520075.1 hypothetical protein [Nanoarchaeota archaeon]
MSITINTEYRKPDFLRNINFDFSDELKEEIAYNHEQNEKAVKDLLKMPYQK